MNKHTLLKFLFIIFLSFFLGCASKKNSSDETFNYYSGTYNFKGSRSLYVGAQQYLSFIPKDKEAKIEVDIHNGTLIRSETNNYVYKVFTKNYKPTYIVIKNGSNVDTLNFFKKKIPPPYLAFGNKSIDTLSVKSIKQFFGFYAILEDFDYNCSFEVISMDILKIDQDNKAEAFINLGNRSSLLRRLMLNAEIGETYIFNNVKLKVEDTDDVIIRGETVISYITH